MRSGVVLELGRRLDEDRIVAPSHPRYEALRRVWNGTIDRRPAAIVRPRSPVEVAVVVGLADRLGLPLAVRGGGHSFPGFSTCDDGVVLDLSEMNAVKADPGSRLVDVGGGALLGDVDRATIRLGLATPAGLVSHTGAGGLTLGGGMGWTSRRLGLTIDRLVSAEVVTAAGEIVEASEDDHRDLFWGLRGGGGNFAVVTRFRYRMHDLGPVTVGLWTYPPDRTAAALDALAEATRRAPRSQTTALSVTVSGLMVTAFHSGPDGLGRDSVLPFGSLAGPGEGGLTGMDYLALQRRSDDLLPWGRRYYGKGGFFGALEPPALTAMAEIGRTAPNDDSEVFMIQLGGAVGDVPDGATAFGGRHAEFFWLVQPIWDDPREDEGCLAWGRQAGQRLAALSEAGNYINEQSEVGHALSVGAYGRAKYDRLARLKTAYDPRNLFRLNQNILPA